MLSWVGIFTEYVPTPENLEYQIWPRALAIAERGLGRTRSYEEFHQWAVGVADSMRQAGINAFDLRNEYGQRRESLQPVEHLARGAKVIYNNPYNSFYKAGGDSTLTDGVCGTWNNNDQRWQGFIRDIDLVLDLGQECEVSSVELSFLQILGPEIFLPAEVSVAPMDKADADGTSVSYIQSMDSTLTDIPFVVQPYKLDLDPQTKTRFLHITAKRTPRRGWLFLDEVVVR